MSVTQPTSRLLLDTHALVWYADNAPQLPETTKAYLNDDRSELYISIVNFWELATLTNVGRIALEPDLGHWFARVRGGSFHLLEIKDTHLLTYAALPQVKDHRDPFDRLLLAQALSEDLTLVSRDGKFAEYPVRRRWE